MQIKVLYPLFILIFISSCNLQKSDLVFRDNILESQGSLLIRGQVPLSFKSLQRYILKPKCMSCHSTKAGKVEPKLDPIDFDSYESMMVERFIPLLIVGKPLKSRLFQSVESGEMPERGRLHDKEIAFIAEWIKVCAPNEETGQIPEKCKDAGNDDDFGDDDDFDDDFDDEDDFDNDGF